MTRVLFLPFAPPDDASARTTGSGLLSRRGRPLPLSDMADNAEARAVALDLLDRGYEPIWAILLVSWHYGSSGRQEALRVVEERSSSSPAGMAVPPATNGRTL
jgi:hypothetical protein